MRIPRLSQRTSRTLGSIGRTLIGSGLIILLFVAYQLWGTGLQHARYQDQLTAEFNNQLASAAENRSAAGTSTTTTTTAPTGRSLNSSASTTPTTPSASTTSRPEPVGDPGPATDEAVREVALGEPVARIRIPAIRVDETIVSGVRVADLRKGPGHFATTPLPGQAGNAAIAGHRTTYGQPFHDLDQLQPGDEIHVTTLQGDFTYRVMGHPSGDQGDLGYFIVAPSAVDVLEDAGDNRLTLVSCHPKFSARQRLIVTAELVEEPVETPPVTRIETTPAPTPTPTPTPVEELPDETPDFGEGLGGDPEALVPTLIWAALFGAGLLATTMIGRWWRRWPSYLVASPALAWLLFSCFVHLDQYLPSY